MNQTIHKLELLHNTKPAIGIIREEVQRMKYLSTFEAAEKWGISHRRVSILCNEGRITGAQRAGSRWIIPENAEKPADARIKSGKYIKTKTEERGT